MAQDNKKEEYQTQTDGLREKMINVNRVTKVVKGGRIMSFAALAVAAPLARYYAPEHHLVV